MGDFPPTVALNRRSDTFRPILSRAKKVEFTSARARDRANASGGHVFCFFFLAEGNKTLFRISR